MHWSPPLPPDDPRAPKYWANEQGGTLAPVVVRYLKGKLLDTRDIVIMCAYLRQWFDSPVWNMNPLNSHADSQSLETLRQRVHAIATQADIRRVLKDALELGIDPL
jgi:hypothetical protein